MADQPAQPKKPAAPVDFVRREISALNRILAALRLLSPARRSAVMAYLNGLMTAESLDRLEEDPKRPS